MDAIKARLESRGTETADSLATRLANAQAEIDFADAGGNFDTVIVNDDLEVAYALLKGIYVKHFRAHLAGYSGRGFHIDPFPLRSRTQSRPTMCQGARLFDQIS